MSSASPQSFPQLSLLHTKPRFSSYAPPVFTRPKITPGPKKARAIARDDATYFRATEQSSTSLDKNARALNLGFCPKKFYRFRGLSVVQAHKPDLPSLRLSDIAKVHIFEDNDIDHEIFPTTRIK